MDNNSYYISHHGIKGQRWGVRRYQNPDGTLTDAGKRKEIKKERKRASKNKSLLSDEELRERSQRLRKENELSQLTKQNIASGHSETRKFLSKNGNRIASSLLVGIGTGAGMYAAKTLITKVLDSEAANVIVRKG